MSRTTLAALFYRGGSNETLSLQKIKHNLHHFASD